MRILVLVGVLQASVRWTVGAPFTVNTNLQFRLLLNTVAASGANSVRLAKDPRNNQLYYLKLNGDIYRLDVLPGAGTSTSSLVYSSADHGLSQNVQGMAIGTEGTIYLVGNDSTNSGQSTIARIMKGVPQGGGGRAWSLLAQTEPYPLGNSGFDHLFNGIIVSPDGANVYVNSGARTDHGEVQSNGGVFPNTRDVPLTAKIFVLPTSATGLLLPNDLAALRSAVRIFAEGTRNAFDFGFAPGGELFAIDNGPDRDMSDELNWLRPGLHYGFPWRMGGGDNPQQFPNYNPTNDPLLDPRFFAVHQGFYHNDPSFPPPATNFTEPVLNIGPQADEFRNPTNGAYEDASVLGQAITTFTAHRAPLGLVFDRDGAMASPFHNHGFVLGFTPGDSNGTNVAGPFFDPSQDLLDLDLVKLGGTNFQARVTRLMAGFNLPVDAEIISNRIYVLEYGGNQGVWEISFPPAAPRPVLNMPQWLGTNTFRLTVTGVVPGQTYQVQRSTNLFDWITIENVTPPNAQFVVTDSGATSSASFYRVSSAGP
ncbi:MAG TPA: PQQ-dependent sugar dehydrogenase [Candidatus Dormibacteraeota bacterium]|nr:PQQ-dependent sugar dehydrogenase [Candidatus Dormibacteraeota bacterium]